MNVLCFDIASGGLSAGIFNERLSGSNVTEVRWHIPGVLDVSAFDRAFSTALRSFAGIGIDAISFSTFMHSCVLLDAADEPLTPIFTWMDRRGSEGVDYIRREFGTGFHQRTGCRFHPMFPVFKLGWLRVRNDPALAPARRIVSAKSLAIARLTGEWVEDHGTASASGLYDVRQAGWDPDLVDILQLHPGALPRLVDSDAIVGVVTNEAAARYGVEAGIPVIAGSGDGFMANLGSGCLEPSRIAVTLGTSAGVRQSLPSAVLDDDAGTFCYRADSAGFLLGCAGSNGGNVLDWARSVFGALPESPPKQNAQPTFIPLLNGERSPEWNPSLTASWHGVDSRHTAGDLAYAVVEGVVFNLAHYVDIVQKASGQRATQLVLSGNGFLDRLNAEILASVLEAAILLPQSHGLASLCGAAVCGLRALGESPTLALEKLVADAEVIPSKGEAAIQHRFLRYLELRAKVLAVLPSGA